MEEFIEEIVYNKIYARADETGKVIHIFSEAFEQPQEGDICINDTNTERHGAQAYPVFDENGFYNYKIEDGVIIERDKTADLEERNRESIRGRRGFECFTVINRGQCWYDKLTEEQKTELTLWYEGWLNAPQTGDIPERPAWIDIAAKQEAR